MAAMHSNEMINVKAKFETLHGVHLNDIVQYEGKSSTLNALIKGIQSNNINLFLAAEQGTGKGKENVLIVINPKAKSKAIKWLMEDYPAVIFKEGNEISTSINVEQY